MLLASPIHHQQRLHNNFEIKKSQSNLKINWKFDLFLRVLFGIFESILATNGLVDVKLPLKLSAAVIIEP